MDFQLDRDILILKENIRKFIQKEVEAVAADIEEQNNIPERIIEMSKELGYLDGAFRKNMEDLV